MSLRKSFLIHHNSNPPRASVSSGVILFLSKKREGLRLNVPIQDCNKGWGDASTYAVLRALRADGINSALRKKDKERAWSLYSLSLPVKLLVLAMYIVSKI